MLYVMYIMLYYYYLFIIIQLYKYNAACVQNPPASGYYAYDIVGHGILILMHIYNSMEFTHNIINIKIIIIYMHTKHSENSIRRRVPSIKRTVPFFPIVREEHEFPLQIARSRGLP